jgi:hypothetical protein
VGLCTGFPADQQWRLQPDGTLKNLDSGRCVEVPGYATGSGVNLQVRDCTGGWNQVWTPNGATSMANNQSQRCADLFDDGTTNGTQVVTWVCNNDPNQLWQQQPNNTWKNPVSNRCLDIVGSGTAAGTFVQLWDCTGAANQIWVPQTDGTLKNPNSNRCLDTGANPATQQRLRIADCSASSVTQKWIAGIPDRDGLANMPAEQRTLDGGTEVATAYHDLTVTQTGTRDGPQDGDQTLTALRVTETATRARTKLAATNSWRWTETQTVVDSYGLPTQVKDLGDTSTTTDDVCTTTSYARNTGSYLINFPAQMVTRAGAGCGTGDPRLGETRVFYEPTFTLGAAPAAPTFGLPLKSQVLVSQVPSDVWASTQAGYDNYGRVTSATDARGKTTAYRLHPGQRRPGPADDGHQPARPHHDDHVRRAPRPAADRHRRERQDQHRRIRRARATAEGVAARPADQRHPHRRVHPDRQQHRPERVDDEEHRPQRQPDLHVPDLRRAVPAAADPGTGAGVEGRADHQRRHL